MNEHAKNIRPNSATPVAHKLDTFPAFHKLAGRRVAIVGGGAEAAAKLRLLSETSAQLVVFADHIEAEMVAAIRSANAEHVAHLPTSNEIADMALLFTALESEDADRLIVDLARGAGVPVNAVDRPHLCDFITPSIVNRAPVTVAISTHGTAPVLARRLKALVEAALPSNLGGLAHFADGLRDKVASKLSSGDQRRKFWERFFDGAPAQLALTGDEQGAALVANNMMDNQDDTQGHVALIGAGPGAEDLLTLRAHRILQNADVVLYDALVSEEIMRMARRDAEKISVGKRKGCHSKSQDQINALIIEQAQMGKKVVRLKSGDPMIFGRAGEEIAAMRAANVSYEIVPGITTALAAAAEAEIPLTLRGTASSVVFTTGHDLKSKTLPDWAGLALSGATIAIYMGRTVAESVAMRLNKAGLPLDTPVAVLENVSRKDKTTALGTLKDLIASSETSISWNGKAALILIGEAVAGARLDATEILAQQRIQNDIELQSEIKLASRHDQLA